MNIKKPKKIIFFCNHATFFVSHRLNLYKLFQNKDNMEPFLIIGKDASISNAKQSLKTLSENGVIYKIINLNSTFTNIFKDIYSLIVFYFNIFKERPDIIHAITLKPILFTSILSFFFKYKLILSFSGFGYLFISEKNSFVKKFYILILKLFIIKSKTFIIVQNSRDYKLIINEFRINKKNISLINGSGVDLNHFKFNPNKVKSNIVLFPSRTLKSKGTLEFLESAKFLKNKYKNWKFVLIGDISYQSPDSVNINIINDYVSKKYVELWKFSNEMKNIYDQVRIVCLPSYREGMPKVLLEAAAMGIPTITSDDEGCTEAIIPNETGLVCKKRNITSLINTIEKLINDSALYKNLSNNSISLAKNKFDINIVNKIHLELYEKII